MPAKSTSSGPKNPTKTPAFKAGDVPNGKKSLLAASVKRGSVDVDIAGISIEYPPDIGAYEFDSGVECPDAGRVMAFNRFLRYKRFLSWGGAGGSGSAAFPYTFPFCLE